jgi:hypothetical protein
MPCKEELEALLDIYWLVNGHMKGMRMRHYRQGRKEVKQYVRRHRRSETYLWTIVLDTLAAIRRLHDLKGKNVMTHYFDSEQT